MVMRGDLSYVLHTGLCYVILTLFFHFMLLLPPRVFVEIKTPLLFWDLKLFMDRISVDIFCLATRNACYFLGPSQSDLADGSQALVAAVSATYCQC